MCDGVCVMVCRLLAVSGFKTHVLADLRGAIRFEKFSYQNIGLVGTKMPGQQTNT